MLNSISHIDIFLVATVAAGLIGFYIGHRGITGVKSDMGDIQKDVSFLKGKISGQQEVKAVVPATPVVAPVA